MLIEERGAQLAPFEKALLDNFDGRVALVLVNGDRCGYCDLTEAFVSKLLEKMDLENDIELVIVSRIVNCNEFLTPKVIDMIFAKKDKGLIRQYLSSSLGYGMESRHIIALIEFGNEELTDFYFRRFASMVLTDDEDDEDDCGCFAPVVRYLKQSGLYNAFRAKYMPPRFTHS